MSDRRNVSSSLSAQIINYLRERGHTQADIARMLRVSEGFISLVKSKDRSLTIDHLELISGTLEVPLGAFLMAVSQPKSGKDAKKLFNLSAQVMDKADRARQAILRSVIAPSR